MTPHTSTDIITAMCEVCIVSVFIYTDMLTFNSYLGHPALNNIINNVHLEKTKI